MTTTRFSSFDDQLDTAVQRPAPTFQTSPSKRRTLRTWIGAFACVLVLMSPRGASSETPPSVAGTWDVTTRMPGSVITEQWTIQQKGATITATAKGARGDMPVSGTVAGASFRVTITDGNHVYKVRATVDGDAIDGSIAHDTGVEYSWHARRAKTK
jgi:hypothetical protein